MKLLYLHFVPLKVISYRSYGPLHMSPTGLEASPKPQQALAATQVQLMHCRYVKCILQLSFLCMWQGVWKLHRGRLCHFTAHIFLLRYTTQVVKQEMLGPIKGLCCGVSRSPNVHGRPLLSFNPYFLNGSLLSIKRSLSMRMPFSSALWIATNGLKIIV
jgi:hypothetical protein